MADGGERPYSEASKGSRPWASTEGSVEHLRMLTLNVGGPSQQRAQRIQSFLSEINADLMVLTETRGTAGTQFLLGSYLEAGYSVTASSELPSRERGVAVVHRLSGRSRSVERVKLAHRVVVSELLLPEPVVLIGAYVPSRDASPERISRKRRFLMEMTRLLKGLAGSEHVILMGDLNIVSTSHEPRYRFFKSWEYETFEAITRFGLIDAFSELYPGQQAYTWVGRTGDGYRYDYGFLSEALRPRLIDCEYINEPRDLRITDHAGMLLTLRGSGHSSRRGEVGKPLAVTGS
jgi:exodeoxyribonuclease III